MEIQQKWKRKTDRFLDVWRCLRRNKAAMTGLIVILIFVLLAVFAGVICDYDMVIKQDTVNRLQAPSGEHWLGTDHLGRDIFARMIYGARVSIGVGFLVVIISAALGGFIGSLSALLGGKLDNLIMRVVYIFTCIPSMLMTLAMVAALGPGLRNLVVALCINTTVGFTRVVRAAVLSIVNQDYISAAKASGFSTWKIAVRHVMPNAMGIIIVEGAMTVAGTILSIAGLSFLGLGIQPPSPEWGAMLNEGRAYMRTFPYMIVFPGIAIILSALAMNLLGDGLRDALDPRSKR